MRWPGIFTSGALVGIAALVMSGCGSSPITSTRIETAIQGTFANLVTLQVARLGMPPASTPDFAVTAVCSRQPATNVEGAGDWMCTLLWQGPDRKTLRDVYDLFVTTDGCYTATVSGDTLGGPTLRAADGREVRNLLYEFEGCFDTT